MRDANTGKAIRLKRPGGVCELQIVDWAVGAPAPEKSGFGTRRSASTSSTSTTALGSYPLPERPFPASRPQASSKQSAKASPAWMSARLSPIAGATGAYATTRLLPAWRVVPLPQAISARMAAASLLRGLTVHMLLKRTHPVRPGETVLVHAAAGGLGMVLTRWIKHFGGRVIGTASSEAKAGTASANGADHVIVGRKADIVGEVAKLTDGQGVDFAVDGIGGTMLAQTFACTRRFGTVASVGQAAGTIPTGDGGRDRTAPLPSSPGERHGLCGRRTFDLPGGGRRSLRDDRGRHRPAGGNGPAYPLAEAAKAQSDLEPDAFPAPAILLP